MNITNSFLKNTYDILEKAENLLLYPLRVYVHKKVSVKENTDDEVFKRTQKVIDKIMESQRHDSALNRFLVTINKGKDVPTILGNGAMFASASYLNRFTDGELAFVTGHEMAHLALCHWQSEDVVNVIGNNDLQNGYKRYCEREADMLGTYYALQAGATLDDCFSAMKKLVKQKFKVKERFAFWEDHPTIAERCAFIRQFYSNENALKLKEEGFAKKVSRTDISNVTDVFRIKLDILRKVDIIRHDAGNCLGETLEQVKEQLREEPLKYGLQTYLDTKKELEFLHDNKKDSTVMYFQEKELDTVVKLAEQILELPEVKKFKGIGVIQGAVNLAIYKDNKEKVWSR